MSLESKREPFDAADIAAARAARNRAWRDRMAGQIDQAALFATIRAIREQFGEAIYDRRLGFDVED